MVQETSATTLDPCAVYAYGGVKDYSIDIVAGGGAGGGGMSGGDVFLIVAPLMFFSYLAAGYAINHRNGKPGIPHADFWKQFPSYVSTGCSVTWVNLQKLAGKGGDSTSQPGGSKDYEEY
jgi:hypothetical protein